MKVITRFAPSPTGDLHLGSARTALFNYLFAKRHGGKFLIRIEDTDKERSTEASLHNILDGLNWLGCHYDGDIIYQSSRIKRHVEMANYLVTIDKAYYCYTSKEEIEKLREESKQKKETFIFQSPYRNGEIKPDNNIKPVIRLKVPQTVTTILEDAVQGNIEIDNSEIEDTILMRADGTPTYMLAVVVDDIDMEITHIIRGADHITNSFRQILIYKAFNKKLPIFAHIPLIHGSDGAKMSKRHGATSLLEYKELGYLPETMLNYLVRLGWSHGNDEIISLNEAIEWFGLEHIGKSPSRFDKNKLDNLNFHYINAKTDEELVKLIKENINIKIDEISFINIKKALKSIKERSKSIKDLISLAKLYIIGFDIEIDEDNVNIAKKDKLILEEVINQIQKLDNIDSDIIKKIVQNIADKNEVKLQDIISPIRILMTGKQNSPSIFEMIFILGKDETIRRLKKLYL